MGRHEDTLRRILRATGALREVSEDQVRELMTHLEEAVEKKTIAGAGEPEAIAQAFEEMGDLSKIAREYPRPVPALVTPEGWMMSVPARASIAYVYLLTFCVLQFTITFPLVTALESMGVHPSSLLELFYRLSALMTENPWVVAGLLVAAPPGLFWLTRRTYARRAVKLLAIALALSCGALAFALALFQKTVLMG